MIKDLHESNANDKLRFVFSTGDFDSLSVGGNVTDSYTGEPVDNVTVMFYDIFTDSIIRQERPYYFSRTDKSGQFTIENMKAGQYKAVAIEDADQNLKWAGESESASVFPDSLITVRDSQRQVLAFRLFGEHKAFRLFDKNAERYGQVKLTYTDRPDSVQVKSDQPNMRLLTERSQDTLLVWYDTFEQHSLATHCQQRYRAGACLRRTEFLKKDRILFADETVIGPAQGTRARRGQPTETPVVVTNRVQPPKTVSQSQAKPAELQKTPVSIFDTSRWVLTVDSARFNNFQVLPDTTLRRKLLLDVRWVPGKTYGLQLLPGAIKDFFGVRKCGYPATLFQYSYRKTTTADSTCAWKTSRPANATSYNCKTAASRKMNAVLFRIPRPTAPSTRVCRPPPIPSCSLKIPTTTVSGIRAITTGTNSRNVCSSKNWRPCAPTGR